jgi:hypothetical protein
LSRIKAYPILNVWKSWKNGYRKACEKVAVSSRSVYGLIEQRIQLIDGDIEEAAAGLYALL